MHRILSVSEIGILQQSPDIIDEFKRIQFYQLFQIKNYKLKLCVNNEILGIKCITSIPHEKKTYNQYQSLL